MVHGDRGGSTGKWLTGRRDIDIDEGTIKGETEPGEYKDQKKKGNKDFFELLDTLLTL